MRRVGIACLIGAATSAALPAAADADEPWRPAHILTTAAESLGAVPLLTPLHPGARAADAGAQVATTARGVAGGELAVVHGTLDAAQTFTSTRVQQAVGMGDDLRPISPTFAERAGTLARPCGRWPLAAAFGTRTRADGHTEHRHPGLSWTVPADTPAAAVAPGYVIHAGAIDGLGWVVVLAHSASEHTIYAQLRRLDVATGETVTTGQPLGASGARTPDGERECYFEIRLDGIPVDPAPWLEPR